MGLLLKIHSVVTSSLGDAQNDYSYEDPKGGKRTSVCSLRAWAAVHPAAAGGASSDLLRSGNGSLSQSSGSHHSRFQDIDIYNHTGTSITILL